MFTNILKKIVKNYFYFSNKYLHVKKNIVISFLYVYDSAILIAIIYFISYRSFCIGIRGPSDDYDDDYGSVKRRRKCRTMRKAGKEWWMSVLVFVFVFYLSNSTKISKILSEKEKKGRGRRMNVGIVSVDRLQSDKSA